MKKICLSFLGLLLWVASFCQKDSVSTKTSGYYLVKSKHQKTAAWIMLGGGVLLTGVGLLTAVAEVISNPVNAAEGIFISL